MSPEERQFLTALFDRVNSAATTAPRDPDAEALINQATRQQPATAYYLAQAVIVQEKGLEAADAHIRELESRVRQLEAGNSQQAQAPAQGGGFLNSIFGTSQQQPHPQTAEPAPGPWGRNPVQPMPQAAPQPSPAPWSQQPSSVPSVGGGFLRGALGTAAGVAGGMLLANSLGGIFSNHMAASGLGSMFGGNPTGNAAPIEETVINNYYSNDNPQVADNSASNNDDGFDQADYDDSDNDISADTSDV